MPAHVRTHTYIQYTQREEESKARDCMRLTHLHCQFDESVCRPRDCWSSLFLILVLLFFVSFRFIRNVCYYFVFMIVDFRWYAVAANKNDTTIHSTMAAISKCLLIIWNWKDSFTHFTPIQSFTKQQVTRFDFSIHSAAKSHRKYSTYQYRPAMYTVCVCECMCVCACVRIIDL